eukprot:NODE_4222_length_327_cov_90.384892_g4140_i0.p2 GENE.NODE_4222_length_327_cov_90.384892_g4140_i0~~NODE_4222_length_327_cov_90.384892_g4140_i0.p2  ORF type:complete len:71 (+),score=25.51 NODE_4222_length_327_cov_90.384892_g4140_i0:24-215(+)
MGIHTYIHTCTHTHIHTYIHACIIHPSIHTYTPYVMTVAGSYACMSMFVYLHTQMQVNGDYIP